MDYAAHYERLIARSRGRDLTGYKERHHVLPKCMGGGNEASNLVDLTPEEHYVAHHLLVKMYPSIGGLVMAAVRMAKQCTGNKAYGWLRRRHAAVSSLLHRGNKHNLGKIHSAATRAKMSEAHRGKPRTETQIASVRARSIGNKYNLGKTLSSESRAKIAAKLIGNKGRRGLTNSPEARAKVSAAIRGRKRKPFTAAARANMAAALMGRPVSAETRAKMSASRRRWAEEKRMARQTSGAPSARAGN